MPGVCLSFDLTGTFFLVMLIGAIVESAHRIKKELYTGTQSRSQRPRSFWSATGIRTPGDEVAPAPRSFQRPHPVVLSGSLFLSLTLKD